MYFYTYLLLGEDGRFYYGHRSCECRPENDLYWGSCYDPSFKPVRKRILKTFPCLDLAIIEEMRIHVTKDVGPNQRYANGVTLRPNGMSRQGVPVSKETREKMSEAHRGKKHSDAAKQKCRLKQLGVAKSNEHRTNMSKARQGKKRFLTPDGEFILARSDDAPPGSTLVSAWIDDSGQIVWTTKDQARKLGLQYASTIKLRSTGANRVA